MSTARSTTIRALGVTWLALACGVVATTHACRAPTEVNVLVTTLRHGDELRPRQLQELGGSL
jgi:hypothetical protein